MIINYIKIGWRQIWKHKLHASINLFGLAMAFTVFILLFLTAYFHLSYDEFHKDSGRLFKMSVSTEMADGVSTSTELPLPLADALKSEIPEVEKTIRTNSGRLENISYNDKHLELLILRTDESFFDVFNFPVVKGDSKNPIASLSDIALSEHISKALFGDENPIGKHITIGKDEDAQNFIVKAILEDCPRNSSIQFDAVSRIESTNNYVGMQNNWEANSSQLFLKLKAGSNKGSVLKKSQKVAAFHFEEHISDLKNLNKSIAEPVRLNFINIEEIHFFGPRSSPKALVYAIMGLGGFILLIACFNFINLNLAYSFKRAKEVGIRKTLGAFKGHLFVKFWLEALMIYFIGFVLGFIAAYQLVPVFNAQFGTRVDIAFIYQFDFILMLVLVFLVVTFIAGGYPALRIANFNLVEVLKGKISNKKPGVIRNSLIVSQFALSTLLIAVSVIASQQLNYLKNKPLGFNKENVLSIPVENRLDGRKTLRKLQNELIKDPKISAVSASDVNLGRGRDRVTSRTTIDFTNENYSIKSDWVSIDYDYFKTLNVPMVEGRDFSRSFASDTLNTIVVTQSFVDALGEGTGVGSTFGQDGNFSGYTIIGVIPDIHVYSPTSVTNPVVFHISPKDEMHYIFVRSSHEQPSLAMEAISSAWDKISEGSNFNGSFLDENIQSWYEGEKAMTQIFSIASLMAILLSCTGLFALSLTTIELRTKEIGIRKVVGASVSNIVSLISSQFLKLIIVSLCIAIPIAWYAMTKWLQNYDYRIDLSPISFILVGLSVCLIAFVTVGLHTYKAAMSNPVKSLRTE